MVDFYSIILNIQKEIVIIMKRIFVLIVLIVAYVNLSAQDKSFALEISNDTVLLGNYTIAKFILSNINGDFEAPEFKEFDIVSGPNTMSSFKMINGTSTQESSYTYYLKPQNEGEIFIDPAYLYTENDTLETTPTKVIVFPNPEGKVIEPKQQNQEQFNFSFPQDDFDFFPKRKSDDFDSKLPEADKKKKKLKTRKL